MGGSKRQGSKSKALGASAGVEHPSVPPADAPGELFTHAGRQKVRADIVAELMGDASESRTKTLAAAGKIVNDYERAQQRAEEDEIDRRVADELKKIERQRAQKRSGVVGEDEAPQLPLAGSPRTH